MSTHDNADRQSEFVADAVTAMKLEQSENITDAPILNGGGAAMKPDSKAASPEPLIKDERASSTLTKSRSSSRTPPRKENSDNEDIQERREDDASGTEKVGGGISVKMEPGQPPKLARSSSQKVVPRPPQLFLDLPDSTEEAQRTFEVIETCQYANKYMGYTEHAMECDCAEEWGESVFIACYICLAVLASVLAQSPRFRVPSQSKTKRLCPDFCRHLLMIIPFHVISLSNSARSGQFNESSMWRGLGLHQPRN
jgi:histone-lysine N-methyltransferase SETD2